MPTLTLGYDRSLFGFNVPILRDDNGHIVDRERPSAHEYTDEYATERLCERAQRNGHTVKRR